MTVIVSALLTGLYLSLSGIHKKNELLFNKKAIITSVESYLDGSVKDLSDEQVETIFSDEVEQFAVNYQGETISEEQIVAAGYPSGKAEEIDMAKELKKVEEDRLFPMFIYTSTEGEKIYITAVRGNGLWDAIWGNIAIKEDFNTIAGAAFDHKGETPGLGAEIKDNPKFSEQFQGKELYDESGKYVAVAVRKGGARESNYDHEVDGITGATITADGVEDMIYKGIKKYLPYFDKKEEKLN